MNILGIDLAALPKSGTAYTRVKALAAKSGQLDLQSNNGPYNDVLLAKAVMGDKAGVLSMIRAAKNRDSAGGVPMGPARNLIAWALALNFAGAHEEDVWLKGARDRKYTDFGHLAYPELSGRANNHGVAADTAQVCIDAHLGDTVHLAATLKPIRARLVLSNPLIKFRFGGTALQPDPAHPVVICPPGSKVKGINADGLLPEEQRRETAFPNCNDYNLATAGYFLISAKVLQGLGTDVWGDGQQAIRRVFAALQRIGCKPAGDDRWLGHMAKALLGQQYLALGVGDGKVFGLTDYLYG